MKADAENVPVPLPGAWSLLKPSWKATRTNLVTFGYLILVPLTLTAAAEGFVAGHTTRAIHSILLVLGWITLIAAILLWSVSIPAISYVRLLSIRGTKIGYIESLKKGIFVFYRWWVLQLLLSLIVVAGFLLLIVPGFFMLHRFVLSRYVLLDQDLKPIDALRESARLAKTNSPALWSTTLLLTAIVAAYTLLPMGLGVLVWVVMSLWNMCGTVLRYEELAHPKSKKAKTKKTSADTKSSKTKKPSNQRRAKKKS